MSEDVLTAPPASDVNQGRPSGFFKAARFQPGVRLLPAIWSDHPRMLIPLFFLMVTIGAIQNLAGDVVSDIDYKAFQLPVAIMTAVTGMSRANALVIDISEGYFDRLLLTPVNRYALLLGLMVADFTLFVVMAVPVIVLGFAIGVSSGPPGVGSFGVRAVRALWGLAFTGFPRHCNCAPEPGAVNSSSCCFSFMF